MEAGGKILPVVKLGRCLLIICLEVGDGFLIRAR